MNEVKPIKKRKQISFIRDTVLTSAARVRYFLEMPNE